MEYRLVQSTPANTAPRLCVDHKLSPSMHVKIYFLFPLMDKASGSTAARKAPAWLGFTKLPKKYSLVYVGVLEIQYIDCAEVNFCAHARTERATAQYTTWWAIYLNLRIWVNRLPQAHPYNIVDNRRARCVACCRGRNTSGCHCALLSLSPGSARANFVPMTMEYTEIGRGTTLKSVIVQHVTRE